MKIPLRVATQMFIDNLATSLYSLGQAVMELIRNGFVASQPDADSWDPRLVKIELALSKKHMFTGGPAMVVLDHGCGMTQPRLERYFGWLGTPEGESANYADGQNHGASQKGIGRLSPLLLNKLCRRNNPKAGDEGYYLFSRSEPSGNIRFIHVTPRLLSLEEGIEVDNHVSPDSTEARFLEGIKGTFTAIVIPNPVFESADEIEESIKWLIPREKDKMFDLSINGKKIEPPPLWDEVNASGDGDNFRARIGTGNKASDGIWLCDSVTSNRVASCVKLGRLLPEVLGYPDLAGDIFAPGLLQFQNTPRDSLSKDYTHKDNPEWQKLIMFCNSRVVPRVQELVERDALEGDTVKILDDLVEWCNESFGRPERDKPPGPPGPGPGPGPGGGKKPGASQKRGAAVKIGNKVWRFHYNQPLGESIFAMPSSMAEDMILINVRGQYLPLSKLRSSDSRREHCIMQILYAIGEKEGHGSAHEACKFVGEIRSQFKEKKKRKGG